MNIVISVNGTDITDDVILADATFTSMANGAAGTCSFRVRDAAHVYTLIVGKEITLDIDGVRTWGGFISQIERGYFFDAYDCKCRVKAVPRYLEVHGVDYNVLFQKRWLEDFAQPKNVVMTQFPAGTADSTVIDYYIANHLDLSGDGISTALVQHVDTPSTDEPIFGQAGMNWDAFMRRMAFNTGAIWYLNPDKTVVFADVETEDAPYGISDNPGTGQIGCQGMEILFDGSDLINDALVWGLDQASTSPVFARVSDATSITTHGRWQHAEPSISAYKKATVTRTASTFVNGSPQSLRGHKDDAKSIKCAIFQPGFRVAQKVHVTSDVFGFDDIIPIRAIKVSFPTTTQARWDLTIATEYDTPWIGFDVVPFIFQLPKIDIGPIDFIPHIPQNNPCAQTDNCCDTFTRSGAGLGTSEFGGYVYQGGTTVFQTNGSALEVLAYSGLPSNRAFVSNVTLGYPLRFQYQITPIASGVMRFETFINDSYIGGTHGYYRLDVVPPIVTGDQATITIAAVDSLSVGRSYVAQPPMALEAAYNIQLYLTPTIIAAKFWLVGDVEPPDDFTDRTADLHHVTMNAAVPDSWTMAPQTVWSFLDGNSTHVSVGDPWAIIDNFCILEGLICNGNGQVSTQTCGYLDTFQRSNTNGWGMMDTLQFWTAGRISNNGLTVSPGAGLITHVDLGDGYWTGDSVAAFASGGSVFNPLANPQIAVEAIEGTFDFQPPDPRPTYGGIDLRLSSPTAGYGIDSIGLFYGTSESFGIRARRTNLTNTATTVSGAFSWTAGTWYSVRAKVDSFSTYLRVWEKGQAEPTTWNLTATPSTARHGNTPFWNYLLATELQSDTGPSTVKISNVCILVDQCTDATVPDPPQGPTCLNLVPLDTPPGGFSGYRYYSTDAVYPGNPYMAGSSQVWFDGLFLRNNIDYIEDPNNGIIAVTNTDLFSPVVPHQVPDQYPHVVYMCAYFQTQVIST